MTYRIDPSHYIENGPTIAADAAIARIRRAALTAALEERKKAKQSPPDIKKAA